MTALHVAHRPEGEGLVVEEGHLDEATHAATNVVASAVELGQRLGVAVDPMIRIAPHPEQEIIELANGGQFDLLVLGTSTRPFSDRPYLGHRAHYILDRTHIPVAVVSLPAFGIRESR